MAGLKKIQSIEALTEVTSIGANKLNVKDTEFILRKLMESQYDGREIEQASDTIGKIKGLHAELLEHGIDAT